MGSFAVKRDGTLRGAIEAFGTPGDKDRAGLACIVRWPRHGLKINFYNLGGHNPCRPAFGFFARPRQGRPLADGSGTRDRRPAAAPQEPVPERAVPAGRAGLLARGLVARPPMVTNWFWRLLPRPAREDAGPAHRPVARSVCGRRRLTPESPESPQRSARIGLSGRPASSCARTPHLAGKPAQDNESLSKGQAHARERPISVCREPSQPGREGASITTSILGPDPDLSTAVIGEAKRGDQEAFASVIRHYDPGTHLPSGFRSSRPRSTSRRS